MKRTVFFNGATMTKRRESLGERLERRDRANDVVEGLTKKQDSIGNTLSKKTLERIESGTGVSVSTALSALEIYGVAPNDVVIPKVGWELDLLRGQLKARKMKMITPISTSRSEDAPGVSPVLQKWQLEQDAMRSGMANPTLYQLAEYLAASLQDDPDLGKGELMCGEANDYVYPFIHFPIARKQQQNINSILGKIEPSRPTTDEFVENKLALDYWRDQESAGRAKDRPTYRLTGVKRSKQVLTINAAVGGFRDSIVSQDFLERELLLEVGRLRDQLTQSDFEKFLRNLSTRTALLAKVDWQASRLLQGSQFRSAAIAASLFTVCRDTHGRLLAPVRLRSADGVAMHARMFHVVPSGMFQPTTGDAEQQWDLTDFVFREFGEELFAPEEDFDEDYVRRYLNYAPNKFLKELLDENQARLYLTGFGYNLWNLRPEILLLLFIDTPDWYQIHCEAEAPDRWKGNGYEECLLRFNREFLKDAGPAFVPVARDGRWATLDELREPLMEGLRSEQIEAVKSDPFHPAHWVPPGAAAFWLGLKVLREKIEP